MVSKEEYKSALNELTNYLPLVDFDIIRHNIDITKFIVYVGNLEKMSEYAEIADIAIEEDMKNDLDDYIKIRTLIKAYEKVYKDISCITRSCILTRSMLDGALDDEEEEENKKQCNNIDEILNTLSDYSKNRILCDPLNIEGITDKINEAKENYIIVVKRFSDIVRCCIINIGALFNTLKENHIDFYEIAETAYYDFLSAKESKIREKLYGMLYDSNIVEDASREPTDSDWSKLLKNLLSEHANNPFTEVISRIYCHTKPIDIKNQDIIEFIEENCESKESFETFFYHFAEIAVLQENTRKNITMIRNPQGISNVVPLTDMPYPKINDDDEAIVAELCNIFYKGDEDRVRDFLAEVKKRKNKNMEIIRLVHIYVKDKYISDCSCNRDLWKILHDHGLYKPTESNWNKALRNLK